MKEIYGIAGAPGVVLAKAIYFEKNSGAEQVIEIDEAVEKALEKVRRLYQKTLRELGEEHAKIFTAYEMLLEDTVLLDPIRSAILAGEEATAAVRKVTGQMADILASKKNEYMRQRADDIRYVGELLADAITGADGEFILPDDGEKYILAAHELTPVDTMMFDRSRLAGLVTELGGATSHTVILAKSLGIPAVVGASGLDQSLNGTTAYLDGYTGKLLIDPDENEKKSLLDRISEEERFLEHLDELKNSQAQTKDGERIAVCINIGKPSDLEGTEKEQIDGVGLFRSEFLYSSEKQKPTCKEQEKAYREVLQKIENVTIRTLDVGGDKQLSYLDMPKEDNPFLGNRGIRLCLGHPEIFSEQLRAILLAGEGKKVKIMLPMVTSVSEITRTKELLDQVQKELDQEQRKYCQNVLVGIMIETPASAAAADIFAKHSDFFSIGTNDLVQYMMAADRGNAEVESLYNPYHPAVIRMLANVIKKGAEAGIEVSVCGDLAANTSFTRLLLGLGLKKFSVPLPMVSRIKDKISQISLSDANMFAEAVLKAEDEEEIKKMLKGA